jgi:GTP cyclohydrolase I
MIDRTEYFIPTNNSFVPIQISIYNILKLIGDDPNREGLKDTPRRVEKMYKELFYGYDESKKPKVTTFPNGQDGIVYDQMIIDEGTYNSFCEHHMMPFGGKYWFSYIPDTSGSIVGLSKIARVVDYYSARLQVQERLVQQIVEHLWNELSQDGTIKPPVGMAMVMKGKHMCKTMRGAKKDGEMTTIELRGAFRDNPEVRAEFLKFVNGGN